MRKKIIAGNWKMNLSYTEGEELLKNLLNKIADNQSAEVVIAPPFTYLVPFIQISNNKKIKIAAQNCAIEKSGAFTGEVSSTMLLSCGVEYVIIGHSERRTLFFENDEIIKLKVNRVIESGMKLIYCCGESKETRLSEKHESFVTEQLENNLFHLNEDEFKQVIIAYEPIWAIGTGLTATPEQAEQMHAMIRKNVAKRYNSKVGDELSILYGGSVNASNAHSLFKEGNIDGALVGGASLKADDFLTIINAI